MPYKPRSLDDINSLYDSDIAAARAIEQGKSKVKEDAQAPTVSVPPTSAADIAAPGAVGDISSVVDELIRAMNSGDNASKPSKIRIDNPSGQSARKPSYRPGIHAPRTGVQSLGEQKASGGRVVTHASARQTVDERPFRAGQPYDQEEGGPSYARQKAAADEARRSADEAEKQRRREEYRRMLTSEDSDRRTDEQMSEFISEYASVMNDEEDGGRNRRAKRKERKASHAKPQPPEQPHEQRPARSGNGFEDFFYDVTGDIPQEQRERGSNNVQSSDFDSMFADTDMATLPYSAKQFVYEQKLMYEDQARRAKEEYERRSAEDYARNLNEQEMLRAEQERIRREAEARRQQDVQLFAEREYELNRQREELERKLEEDARLMAQQEARFSTEISDLTAERDRLLAEHEELSLRMREDAKINEETTRQREAELAALVAERNGLLLRQNEIIKQRDTELEIYNRRRVEDIAAIEKQRDETIEKLTAERDRLLAEHEELSRQIQNETLAHEEIDKQKAEELAALAAERDRLLQQQNDILAQKESELAEIENRRATDIAELERQSNEEIERLTTERDRLLDEQEKLNGQIQADNLAFKEVSDRRAEELAALESERDALLKRQDEIVRQTREEYDRRNSQSEGEVADLLEGLAAQTAIYAEANAAAKEQDQPAEVENSNADDSDAFEEYADEPASRKAEKRRLKEERALDRAAEKDMVREANERAKAEKAARKAAKKAKRRGIVLEDENAVVEADDESISASAHENELQPEQGEPAEAPTVTQNDVPEADVATYNDTDDEPAEETYPERSYHHENAAKPKRGAARAFFRFVLSLVLVAVIAAAGCIVSIDKVFKLNYGEKSLIGNYLFFTASDTIEGANISADDIVVVRGADSAENGDVVAYVDRDGGAYGFGTKSNVTINSNGEAFYNFAQGGGVSRSMIVGVVQTTIPAIGSYLALATEYSSILFIGLAAVALILFIIIVFAMRNKNKKAIKRAKKAAKAERSRRDYQYDRESEQGDADFGEVDAMVDEEASFEPVEPAGNEDNELSKNEAETDLRSQRNEGSDEREGNDFAHELDEVADALRRLDDEAEESVEPDRVAEDAAEAEEDKNEDISNLLADFSFNDDEDDSSRRAEHLGQISETDENAEPSEEGFKADFENINSWDDGIVIDEDTGETPYEPGDGTFFGDSGDLFDFDAFDEEAKEEDRRSSRRKKGRNKRHMETYTAGTGDNNDVFDSL